ncbi:hypothetical protein J7L06_07305, partial [Candidatus Bathyarchaeota archaeon]|nr:hypothetical protein [Candidatus Bathyarchaeota archaeon]
LSIIVSYSKIYLRPCIEGIAVAGLGVTFTEDQLKLVLNKLDMVRLELLRLRAALLPEEELSEEEKRELESARKEIKKGQSISLEDLIKEVS